MPGHPIHIIYRVIFLYIEPLAAFLGGCQALLYPATLLSLQTPNSAPFYRSELRPVTTQIAGGWFFLAFNDAVLLRVFPQDTKVWRLVLAGGLLSDLVYITSIWMDLGHDRFFFPNAWNVADAGTIVSTVIPMAAKVTAVLGWGIGTSSQEKTLKRT